ncbi:glycoside hydrolase family 3 C-terminal domain-containing protein [Bifidobacterium pseudolongum]|uniref:glycoside hydrolase family 3 N-terminal domain-containing protein n=1 Tax=Bifidobacterium pseudolongum TaxID=1694 RepID=UPI001CE1455B|nr:glycoside hydrolase family 3 N-terminal domain-containing protein [Bifidobacterium pseudolongum]UBY94539.1 glycoside hydrolase family 3 C-terminal domain-containing protein [Bifidobacterium pseudolongum]UBZ03372.1 glycoside hydrolase family 3 C-terminal domain-containing protein [Bifidobacterium pseudolongum]UBZ04947.1 glycoside hydrolase family 3 C-terminal domain-containing protein [Bifidobacterium pseudolongum]UDL23957.1 glycoside hydrolase family 3 C-terminal domain-containing protein [B
MFSRESNADYLNPALPIAQRVSDLLGRMTLEEKVGQMMQLDARTGELDELIVKRHVGSILHTSPDNLVRAAQIVRNETRLGIPLLVGDDCIHGYSFWPGATIFPSQLGMACSWDARKVEEAARITAEEVACTGVHWTFSPVLCIGRDTRWGRIDETFGEDPVLIGELASAMVKGYQKHAQAGDAFDEDAILACAKHFAGYSYTQGGRDASEADLTKRALESWFLPPFERVAKEGCATFMLGYEAIDGTPVTFNKWLLDGKLRGEWDYRGTLVTDWDNVGRAVWEQHIKPDYETASADAVKAGNDLIMTTPGFYEGAIDAVNSGMLDESLIDDAVARLLTLKFQLGLFENPRLPDRERISATIGTDAHMQANLELARESVVLLRNNGVLPLSITDAEMPRRIAVVGPLADDAQNQLGDWAGNSGQVPWMPEGQPLEMVTTVLDGVRELAPEGCDVVVARGANVVELVPDPEGELFPDGQPRPDIAVAAPLDEALLDEAEVVARSADAVIAVVGDVVQLTGETCSTATLELLGGQNQLLERMVSVARETHKPLVVVLISSKPQVLPPCVIGTNGVIVDESATEGLGAFLWAANPGMQGGRAIAEIIFGMTEPSGRLPITFPRHAGQLPVFYNEIRGQHGDRYADLTQDPAFAFGEGLSYTTFAYGEPRITNGSEFTAHDVVHVEIDLTNTGARAGTEIVQLYISDIVTSYTWACKELKDFRRVTLEPGETARVAFDLPVSACTIVNGDAERIVEPGEFKVLIGHSSRYGDLHTTIFNVVEG